MRERLVRISRNGRDQVVTIPREFKLPGDEVIMRKDGSRLIISPAKRRSLLSVLARLKPIKDEFSPIGDRRPRPVKL